MGMMDGKKHQGTFFDMLVEEGEGAFDALWILRLARTTGKCFFFFFFPVDKDIKGGHVVNKVSSCKSG